jgi:acetamidase/formamidase
MRVIALFVSMMVFALPLSAGAQSAPTTHELKASPATVHRGFFDASLKPVLTVSSGDIVRLETATGNPRYFESLGVPREKIPAELYEVYRGVEGAGRGDHTLNGPIAIRGAEPGDVLEIRIRSVEVRLPIAGQGFVPNRGLLPDQFPYEKQRVLWINLDRKTVEYAPGIEVPVQPFWGVMGVAPPASMGRVPSGPPNVFGGNLDNRDLGAGSTLYLPVHVPGALLSIGDGHAVQGYGEVCLSAVEASLKGEIQVVLHKRQNLRWPRAETDTHYITMGLNADLDEAARIATSEMLDFLAATKGLSREDAYMLASAAMDLVVTQTVDGTKGIHAMMPKNIFRGR